MNKQHAALEQMPQQYTEWLKDLKQRIHAARQRATLQVNKELVLLYWQIGQDILIRQAEQGWGAKSHRTTCSRFTHRLSTDERFFAAKPKVYACLCRSMVRCRVCATDCCTITVVSSHHP